MPVKEINLDLLHLEAGGHRTRSEGVCIMEAVAWLAKEKHSDRPACASPIITDFAMGLNDQWSDDQRQKLIPFLPRIVGTADEYDNERGLLAADWLIRTYTPTWLRLAGLHNEAKALEDLAPITDWSAIATIPEPLKEARTAANARWAAARDAARAAAGDAARAAAGDAARAAAGAAARDAAWDAARAAAGAAARAAAWAAAGAAARAAAWDAAGDAARAAARAAAWAAAGAAARAAAWAALEPTVGRLQESALELLDRMCEVGR